MKKNEIKKFTKDQALKNLDKLKKDLFNLRFQKTNGQLTNPSKISQTKKPVIISTGGHNLESVDKVYNFFIHRNVNFALMHCVSIYPTPRKNLNLNLIKKYKNRYPDICIGYSGHENPEDFETVKMAVTAGADILERHVGIDDINKPLNKYSN